ncbi:MAG: sugar phosphate isomerase/epimerase [Ruminococcaceae bacterium]|nr:sugar phosphate isomerase/epimerase [Oscillospiraceae bacterium]
MKRKLGIIASSCSPFVDEVDLLSEIKDVGFDCFFTGRYTKEAVAALRKRADEVGLAFETIHAPFAAINTMWLPGMSYRPIYEGMEQSIKSAAEFGIPTVVTHLSSGWNAPEVNDLGLSRFDELVILADRLGVTLAFENLRKIGNVAYIVDRYEGMKHVGFCYDWGHEHCYTKTVDWMDIYCRRVACTHIHDNHGRGEEKTGDPDQHLLPFDGTVDYAHIMQKLDAYGYAGPLTLEVGMSATEQYKQMTPRAFLEDCYARLQKIAALGEQ